jgi:hypothetical protein
MSAPSKTFTATLVRDGSSCFIPVPFDPRPVFGRVRAPVTVTLNGYSYRSTIAAMGTICVPLRRSHREAAGLEGDETLEVRLVLDEAPRVVAPPEDLVNALKSAGGAWPAWTALRYSHQREHVEAVESAKAPATRARRITAAVAAVAGSAVPARGGSSEGTKAPRTRAERSRAVRGDRRTPS